MPATPTSSPPNTERAPASAARNASAGPDAHSPQRPGTRPAHAVRPESAGSGRRWCSCARRRLLNCVIGVVGRGGTRLSCRADGFPRAAPRTQAGSWSIRAGPGAGLPGHPVIRRRRHGSAGAPRRTARHRSDGRGRARPPRLQRLRRPGRPKNLYVIETWAVATDAKRHGDLVIGDGTVAGSRGLLRWLCRGRRSRACRTWWPRPGAALPLFVEAGWPSAA